MKTKSFVVCLAALFLFMVFTQGFAQNPKLDMKKIADKIIKTMKSSDPIGQHNTR
jgi:hypothetical protein